ncbi:cAMP-specific 3',5'-cyclic phosphodiesterase, isoform F [Astathelohania contejeani]|uniref:cAMP-specific 3',5'-cyclic phosphodiesterase, isoform F n=1 Tax=Astathelohania contejeani TaxID=164912 RepID=A0ABQ7HXZ0_9MICR|nr:cAMP-specific 3',5'-cyclic phosphodiesterase, isoform F [Thelohania contejeani]
MEKVEEIIQTGKLELINADENEFRMSEEEKNKYKTWSTDFLGTFIYTCEEQLLKSVFFIFEKEKIGKILKIDESCIYVFIKTVIHIYYPNPFHNSNHAVEVLYNGYAIFKKLEKYNICSKLENISLFLALFLHDVNHLGLTSENLYNKSVVLRNKFGLNSLCEKMHFFISCKILLNEKKGIFKNLNDVERSLALSVIKECILATDIKGQSKIIELFKNKYFITSESVYKKNELKRNNNSKEVGRVEFLMIIKMADLTNLTKSRSMSFQSAQLLKKEMCISTNAFSCQVDIHGECTFFKKIVLPLFQIFSLVFEELRTIYSRCYKNYLAYKKISRLDEK